MRITFHLAHFDAAATLQSGSENLQEWLLRMFLSGGEAAGIWEGNGTWFSEWHPGGISLPFASVEDACGASLKIHWTTNGEGSLLGSCMSRWPLLAGVCCYPGGLGVVQMRWGNK